MTGLLGATDCGDGGGGGVGIGAGAGQTKRTGGRAKPEAVGWRGGGGLWWWRPGGTSRVFGRGKYKRTGVCRGGQGVGGRQAGWRESVGSRTRRTD